MEPEVSLTDYFNRLEPVQKAVSRLMAARDLVHHHVGNGAQVLLTLMGNQGKSQADVSAFHSAAENLRDTARREAQSVMEPVLKPAMDLQVHNLNLATLAVTPELLTQESYEGLAALHAQIERDAPEIESRLLEIRLRAEKALIKASGLVSRPV